MCKPWVQGLADWLYNPATPGINMYKSGGLRQGPPYQTALAASPTTFEVIHDQVLVPGPFSTDMDYMFNKATKK